jgi:L,D-peptidoglycan transpeptidase YkuD (ErfK/YbiS/YcfS/YnhG family)
VLLKKNVENVFTTYMRKQRIRQAYRGKFYVHPFFTLSLFTLGVLIILGIFISSYLAQNRLTENVEVKTDTVSVDTATVAVAADAADRFLEPFAIEQGMSAMKFMIVADKNHRVMYVLKQGARKWGVIKTYPIAVGANEGRKQVEGDKKTPEGLYFIVEKKLKNELNEIYGPLAYILNYPNNKDREEGRSGSGIWIHGTVGKDIAPDTRGCMSLHNFNVVDLSNVIGDGNLIPVFIINESRSDLQNLINLKEIWAERLIVAKEFGFNESGERIIVADDKKTLPVEGEQIALTTRQTLPSQQRVEPEITRSPVTENPAITNEDVIRFVRGWAEAWGSRDIEIYGKFYDTQNFPGWTEWKADKRRKFEYYDTISVVLSNIKVISISESAAVVRFNQSYRTEKSAFASFKQLRLSMRNGAWKITNESVINELRSE